MLEDSTLIAKEKAKIKGYLNKWNTSKSIFQVVFHRSIDDSIYSFGEPPKEADESISTKG